MASLAKTVTTTVVALTLLLFDWDCMGPVPEGELGLMVNEQGGVVAVANACGSNSFEQAQLIERPLDATADSQTIVLNTWTDARSSTRFISWAIDDVPGEAWKKGEGSTTIASLDPTKNYYLSVTGSGRVSTGMRFSVADLQGLAPGVVLGESGSREGHPLFTLDDYTSGRVCDMKATASTTPPR